MKKDNIKDFIKTHRQQINDDGFKEKLSKKLEYYPVPQKANRKSFYVALIVPVFFLLAVLAIAWLGGWDVFISHLRYNRLTGTNILWPSLACLTLFLLSWLTLLTANWRETY